MNSNSFLFRRKSRDTRPGGSSDAGIIVLLMMALVFVPVVAVHIASLWQEDLFSLPRLAGIGSMLQGIF